LNFVSISLFVYPQIADQLHGELTSVPPFYCKSASRPHTLHGQAVSNYF